MKLAAWLRNRAMWVLMPGLAANALSLLLLGLWAAFTGRFVASSHAQLLFTFTAGLVLLLVVAVPVVSLTKLRTFRALAAGRVGLSVEARVRALGELRRIPTEYAKATSIAWVGGAVVVSAFALSSCDASWAGVARVLLGVLAVIPLVATLLSLLVTNRAREAFGRVAEDLPPSAVLAVESTENWTVRTRLIFLIATFTLAPLALVIDVAWEAVADAPQVLAALAPAARAAASSALMTALTLRLASLGFVALVIAALTTEAAGESIAAPLQALAEDGRRVSAGQLDRPRVIPADGEVWRVTGVFARLCERLAGLVDRVVDVGLQVRTASESLQQTSQRSEASATEQAASLNETSATTEELARSARQIAQNASAVQDLARATLEAAEQGQHDAQAFDAAVERMKQDNRSIAGAVERLQRRVQQIGRIVELINTVADRSDLLALSAELEGSKGGEVGRGFALVGGEMRRLAENVLESTAEVDELISEIREATVRTADATAEGSRLTEHGMALAGDVTASLLEVARLAGDTATRARTITLSTQQQQSGTDQLAEAMTEILRVTRGELDATHRSAEANQQLVALANSLQGVVQRFLGQRGGRS
ncbi:MAG: methyl-accepting chemotaxis protein [Myxococcaceae bacterium]